MPTCTVLDPRPIMQRSLRGFYRCRVMHSAITALSLCNLCRRVASWKSQLLCVPPRWQTSYPQCHLAFSERSKYHLPEGWPLSLRKRSTHGPLALGPNRNPSTRAPAKPSSRPAVLHTTPVNPHHGHEHTKLPATRQPCYRGIQAASSAVRCRADTRRFHGGAGACRWCKKCSPAGATLRAPPRSF